MTALEAGNLAEDDLQARRRESGSGQKSFVKGKEAMVDARRFHTCGEVGHLARNCNRKKMEKGESKKIDKQVKCYNCGKNGHMSMNCPSKALLCNEGNLGRVTRGGNVENWRVTDIVLDTGCSRTIVNNCFVPEEKFVEGQAVSMQCAHGDVALYPIAEVELEMDGARFQVLTAISETWPVSVLLGTDLS